jgi:ATP-dependent Clp protease ATP-binding subunit ClpB
MQIELESLKKDSDAVSLERRRALEQDLRSKQQESRQLTEKWQEQKEKLEEIKQTKVELEKARIDLEIASRTGDLGRASELRYGIIPKLEKKLPKEGENMYVIDYCE